MPNPIDKSLLARDWIHSREEDTPTETVYRPAGFPLPPARGRSGVGFTADGTFKRIGIGPTDVSQVKEGTWAVDASAPNRLHVEVGGRAQLMQVEDLSKDRMTIRKAEP